jgi:hypothetical protein
MMREASSDAATERAEAAYEVRVAEAKGRKQVARELCDAKQGGEKDLCLERAEQAYDDAIASAEAERRQSVAVNSEDKH